MSKLILPGERTGSLFAPVSKSLAHRFILASFLADFPENNLKNENFFEEEFTAGFSDVVLPEDVLCTLHCLQQLKGTSSLPSLDCKESGSTLRFLLPVIAALGKNAVFKTEGLLSKRPTEDLILLLNAHGARIEKKGRDFSCTGSLLPGNFEIPGNISSQYITGLLFALPLLKGDSTLKITGDPVSENYIVLTEEVLKKFSVSFKKEGQTYCIPGNQRYKKPKDFSLEGDWSGAAFFLCLGALSQKGILVKGLNLNSLQGDKKILELLSSFGARVQVLKEGILVQKASLQGLTFDARSTPDLVPMVAALAALSTGETRITGAENLRYKESDRLQALCQLINSFGGQAEETTDGLFISGREKLHKSHPDVVKDHRILMAASLLSTCSDVPVSLEYPDCVAKSYPAFWQDFEILEVLS